MLSVGVKVELYLEQHYCTLSSAFLEGQEA